MYLKQYYLGCLAHASYMIADEETKIAAVVDPQRDIDQYIEEAETNKWDIRYVLLTHFHADFLAGHLELRERTGAQICLGAKATAEYPFRGLKDGDTINFGQVQLRILETPGHTPEGISVVVYDLGQSRDTPHAVLTGDTLFIGDVGRPDLMASVGVSAKELGGMLYDSLHHKLLALPNETLVYPAHGAGSMCGKNLSTDTVSTIGTQRWYNYALQPMSRSEFVDLVASEQPEAPAYFGYDAQLNRQNRETLDVALGHQHNPLSIEELMNLVNKGGQVLDVREPADFAGGHLVNSINIGLSGKFATWAGIVLNPKTPIVIIAEPGREQEAMTRLGRIGFDQVAGYLKDGMMGLKSRPDLITRTTRITAATLAETLTTSTQPKVIDVRTEREWQEGSIEHSLNIPLPHLSERLDEIPKNQPVVVHCASGYRSSIAASLLEGAGFTQVMDLVGGYDAWVKTWGRPDNKTKIECVAS
jgi:glyoxylase-like metal-dependent hydrolase (beta-lactamase superfamily II)/rhodanese-related sulfurtransferase